MPTFANKFVSLFVLASSISQAYSGSVRGLAGTDTPPMGHTLDSSDIETDTMGTVQQQQQCWRKKAPQGWSNVGETRKCDDIVNNPKQEIQGQDCTCELVNGAPKWRATPQGGGDRVDAQFFGNIVGHAKMLCQIVQAIDCWQKDPDLPTFPGFGQGQGQSGDQLAFEQSTVALRDQQGKVKFASFDKVLGTVQKICKVIDGGVGELPGLIGDITPGNGGGGSGGGGSGGGIPGLIGNIIRLIGGGGGGGGGGLLDGLFGSIFVAADGQMALSDDQIPMYTASQLLNMDER